MIANPRPGGPRTARPTVQSQARSAWERARAVLASASRVVGTARQGGSRGVTFPAFCGPVANGAARRPFRDVIDRTLEI
jgi:hypothetical protein